jgi:hypothetical protein
MGQYHDQIALLQVEPINGTRDFNKDYDRRGDRVYPPGLYGIHHHWGYNYPHDDAGRSSAGCQVGRTKDGHNEFISILKKDPRYVANKSLLWTSTVIPASDYSGSRVVIPVVAASTVAAAGLGVMSYWTPIHDQILSYWHLVW